MPKEIKTSCRASHQAFIDLYNQTENADQIVQAIIDGAKFPEDIDGNQEDIRALFMAFRRLGKSDIDAGYVIGALCGCKQFLKIENDKTVAVDKHLSERRIKITANKFMADVISGSVNLDDYFDIEEYHSIPCHEHANMDRQDRLEMLKKQNYLYSEVIRVFEENLGDNHFKLEIDPDTGHTNKIRKTPATFRFDGETMTVGIDATDEEKENMLSQLQGLDINFNG